ncbi:MAG: hypothetical protein ACLSTJ_17310 [Clostridium neonatale]
MSENKLEAYYEKGFDFLFRSPLYDKYKMNLDIISKTESEVINEATEESGPDIVHHDEYYDSEDFKFIKSIMFTKIEVIEYCPICGKEEIIYLLGRERPEELKNELIEVYSYMWPNEECEYAYDSALNRWKQRLSFFIEKCLDENGNFTVTTKCRKGHEFQATFHITDDWELIKIGQYPSRMEFERYIKEYSKVLSKENNRELNSAIGLAAHGIGAGAYVYLRRVFERLVFDIFNKEYEGEVTLDQFNSEKMQDKLRILDIHFNDTINKKLLYGILSKGIHELEESECKEYFNIVLQAILIILEGQLEKKEKDKREKEIAKLINDVHDKLKLK